jgi:uncharacterized membrane protein YdjX (TVP38/TMEM64 family)
VKKLWIALALLALLLALRFSGLGEWLSFETLARHRVTLSGWVSGHPLLSAGAFVAIYTVVAALALPGAVWLTLGGGFLFGAALGTALTVAGATMGATLLFLFAQRVFGADALQKLGPKAEGLARGIQANAWSYLLVLRLVPLFPFFLVNLVPAFCGVRPAVFIVTTGLGIIPGTAVFALSGAGLGRVLDAGGTPSLSGILTPEIIAALCGLAALALLAIPLKKRFSASG